MIGKLAGRDFEQTGHLWSAEKTVQEASSDLLVTWLVFVFHVLQVDSVKAQGLPFYVNSIELARGHRQALLCLDLQPTNTVCCETALSLRRFDLSLVVIDDMGCWRGREEWKAEVVDWYISAVAQAVEHSCWRHMVCVVVLSGNWGWYFWRFICKMQEVLLQVSGTGEPHETLRALRDRL